ncbi:UPF0175 family protein [Sporosarcina ureae]|uniref:Uncharacterized protein n=1 Tax=Sporosarcina ureae TaxID=1571 RepID=A0ABM6JSP4_SPOUR|nr:UPF0175 family protein [Sporosarcina ureae]ARF13023.1 hypothetical protein SporoS204_01815 [Sporosarcina ureae]
MFIEKQVTVALVAELAELPLADFIGLLKTTNITWMEYTDEHLEDDLQAIRDIIITENGSV